MVSDGYRVALCSLRLRLPGTGRAPPEQLSKTHRPDQYVNELACSLRTLRQPQVTAATQQPAFDSQLLPRMESSVMRSEHVLLELKA